MTQTENSFKSKHTRSLIAEPPTSGGVCERSFVPISNITISKVLDYEDHLHAVSALYARRFRTDEPVPCH